MISFNYQYKLKLNGQQIEQVEHILTVCRRVYNYALRQRKDWLNSRNCDLDSCSLEKEYIIPSDSPYPGYAVQCKNLTQAKKSLPNLKSVHSQILQQTLKTLDKAFWDMRDRGFGFPRFKKRLKSFLFPSMPKNCLDNGRVKLPQLGWVRIRQSRDYPRGFTAKQARIIKKASGYYLMICFHSLENCPDAPVGKNSLGIDVGISTFIATSEGELFKAPRLLKQSLRQLKLLQRRLKRKIKGSKLWLNLNKKIGKLHEKIANARRDWHFKLAHHLCDKTDNIFVENINFISWSKGIFRKISLDYGIGQFINEVLPYVCWKRSKYYLKVDKDGTSQECPNCLKHTGKKDLRDRIHHCQYCGHTENRDTASAKIIRNRGVALSSKKGLMAVGHTVKPKTAGRDDLTGVKQLSLFDLVKS